MKISSAHARLAGLTGLLLSTSALAQAPVVTPPVRVPSQGLTAVASPPPDPLATLKLMAVCPCLATWPSQIASISATAVTLTDGQQWLVNANTIVRSGMTLLSLANLRQGQYVIVEGTAAPNPRPPLTAVIIEAFDYSATLAAPAYPPLTLSGPSGSVSAYFGVWTTYMDFAGVRLNQLSMRGKSLPAGSSLFATVRTGSDGRLYVVAMAIQ